MTGALRNAGSLLLLALVGAAGFWGALTAPTPLADEEAYVCAARALVDGHGLAACPRYLYGEGVARAAAAVLRLVGPFGLLALLRALVWLGAAATVWLSLSLSSWPWRFRVALGIVVMLGWSPVTQALTLGNLSAATAGLAVIGLTLRRSHAWGAGILLGLAIALKPLPAAIPIVLLGYAVGHFASARRLKRPELVCSLVALGVAGLLALVGGGLAPAPAFSPAAQNPITLVRMLHQLGVAVPPLACFLVVVLVGGALAWGLRPRPPLLDALGLVTSLLASPLVWNHSFLLAAPLIIMALSRAVESYRSASAGSPARKRAVLALLGSGAGALFITVSDALGELAHGSAYGVMLVAVPLFAPAALMAYLWCAEPTPD